MHEVLVVYKQVSMQFDENGNLIIPDNGIQTVTLSYDEKPGIQAIGEYLSRIAIQMQHTDL